MSDYERSIFGGMCPYTGEPCADKIPCIRCRMDEAEKEMMESLDEQERLEVWEEEMRGYQE